MLTPTSNGRNSRQKATAAMPDFDLAERPLPEKLRYIAGKLKDGTLGLESGAPCCWRSSPPWKS
jgi:hypothetical protein